MVFNFPRTDKLNSASIFTYSALVSFKQTTASVCFLSRRLAEFLSVPIRIITQCVQFLHGTRLTFQGTKLALNRIIVSKAEGSSDGD